MQSSQATHADELADRQTASTRRAARRVSASEISAGSGEDDKLIGTLRLCAARAQKEAASAPLAMLHDRLDQCGGRGAPFCSRVGAPNSGRGHRRFSRRRIWRMPGGSRRCACDSAPQFIDPHTAVAAKRPRVGEAEVDARLVRSLAVPTAIGLEASPCSCKPGQEASAARQDALGETSTADMEGDETDPRASMPLTPRPATLARRSSAAEAFETACRALIYQCTSANSVAAHAARRWRAPASSLSSSEGSAILLAPRASAGAVGLATRLMRVVDSGDVVQAEPSSGGEASIVSFLRNQQWQQKSRLWSAIGRCMTRAMRSARK